MKGVVLKNTISQKIISKKKDWCTSSPETWRGRDLSECCRAHDLAYEIGRIERSSADKSFRKCISKQTSFVLGWFMWSMVRVFGGSHYNKGENG